jgi:cytochrome subunit of sulfide dehydrogenase
MRKPAFAFVFSFVLAAASGVFVAALNAQTPAPTPAPATTPTPAPAPAATAPAPPPPAFAAANLTPNGVRSLAANCAACHGTNGKSAGGAIVALAGMNQEYFVNQMKLFKEGKREATLMHQIAKGYSDAEIAALGTYFAAQQK